VRYLSWNLAFATWLLVSAFALPNGPVAQAATWAAAVAIGALGIAAVARPALRFAISGIAVALALAALLVPDVSTPAAVSDAVVAAILFALSVVQPGHAPVPATKG
jgi:hypothetical protein